MRRSAISAFAASSTRYPLRRDALLIRDPWSQECVVPALRRTAEEALYRASGTRPAGRQFFAVAGVADAGWAAACGARPTITVSRPCPHNRLAAFLASSSVTASTMALRFSM